MAILVTGCAGFIGFHSTLALLARGEKVVGVDSLNNYYDPALKQARLAKIHEANGEFKFYQTDIADVDALKEIAAKHSVTKILHLAAQAGVRYSLEEPFSYAQSNLIGHLSMLELARYLGDSLQQFVYASSSSVYGANTQHPYAVSDRTDSPKSLYAATKKSGELMTESYVRLYNIPAIGLRFFTVYGPYGRPDMAYFSFTQKILADKPIDVFNHGNCKRDFTYIDDIVAGILASLDLPKSPEHRVYNLGNHQPEKLLDFIAMLEKHLGKEAAKNMLPMQAGDVEATFADISESKRDLNYQPQTSLDAGLSKFVAWYQKFYC